MLTREDYACRQGYRYETPNAPPNKRLTSRYANYVSRTKAILQRILESPWNARGNVFAVEDNIVTVCGRYIRNKAGLYDYHGNTYVMMQTYEWPREIMLQCISKPATENAARFKFGMHLNGKYDLKWYVGPAFDKMAFFTLANGTRGIEYDTNGDINHHANNEITHYTSEGKLRIILHCAELGIDHHNCDHTSLEDDAKITSAGRTCKFRFIEHRWRLIKVVEFV